jgi:hypothetical protein
MSDLCSTLAGMVTAEGEHVNRGRDTASFCPTLQVLDMSFLLSVFVVVQPSSEVPEGLINYAIYIYIYVCVCVCVCVCECVCVSVCV